ncbi:putative ATP-dependent RNA helicase DDX47 [Porphyridium purpureum]|uniref:Putative ATP-dependent RNA helicase DDX47 n=1 Tax=Porphyridium purpureum TaxID=35688 RepID=A0A5J4YXR0_PORPP|nr:putative ATP-dependent RNA helicase DDX47 [Porphyridium purpureum]|eukprot:POR7866..scf208_2
MSPGREQGGRVRGVEAGADSEHEEETVVRGSAEAPGFAELGLCPELCDAVSSMGYTAPTSIQREALPPALAGSDVIGLAETGSGKTAAFALPVLQALLEASARQRGKVACPFAVVIAPTRELVLQIQAQFQALGAGVDARAVSICGGIDMVSQSIALAKKPHVVVATPGRLVDHLENTRGFSLRSVKFLVLDEADRLLNMDFEKELDKILAELPRGEKGQRQTLLFSATMTNKVAKLQRASLVNPVKVQVSQKFATVDKLVQHYLFIPSKYKEVYLVYLANEFAGNSAIVFVDTQNSAQRLTYVLRNLGFKAVCIHGGMQQPKRISALNKFKAGDAQILLATDVAARGLDIPSVDFVVNFDIPANAKDYIHRVGRTARAGRAGRAINMVSQYDVENFQRVEAVIGKKLDAFPCEEAVVLLLLERTNQAARLAALQMKDEFVGSKGKRGNKRGHSDGVDTELDREDEPDEDAEVQKYNTELVRGSKHKNHAPGGKPKRRR